MTEQVTPFQTTVVVFTTTGSMVRHSAAFSYSCENSINDNYRMIKGLQNWKHLPVISGWGVLLNWSISCCYISLIPDWTISLSMVCTAAVLLGWEGRTLVLIKRSCALLLFIFKLKKVFKCRFSTDHQCNMNEI